MVKNNTDKLRTIYKYNSALILFAIISSIFVPILIRSVYNDMPTPLFLLLMSGLVLVNVIWLNFAYSVIQNIIQVSQVGEQIQQKLHKVSHERNYLQLEISKTHTELLQCQTAIKQLEDDFLKVIVHLKTILKDITLTQRNTSLPFPDINDISSKLTSNSDIIQRTN